MAVLLIATLVPFPGAASAPNPGDPIPNSSTLVGDYYWQDEHRLTNGLEPDFAPQVRLDANLNAHFLWRRGTGTGEAYFLAEGDAVEANFSTPIYISNRTYRDWQGQISVGSQAGLDREGSVHIVFDDSGNNVFYTKVDKGGTVNVSDRRIGPLDNYVSKFPALALGIDDTVHVGHVENRFKVADIAYNKLDNGGQDIWIDRIVSSDLGFSSATVPNVVADAYNGNILFVMGTVDGTYLARYNKFGTKDMPSVRVRNDTDFKVPDVTASPQGNMSLVWEDGGNLVFSVVNRTGSLVVNASTLVGSGSVLGAPRVRADSSNNVLLAWQELVNGTPQIMFGILGANGQLNQSQTLQVSNSSTGASAPWLALSPNDEPIVAWVDGKDGNQEVYYRYGVRSVCHLTADPISIANLFFIHPNETKVLPLRARNGGSFAEDFMVWEEHQAPPNWSISVAPTSFPGLGRGEAGYLNLTIFAPPEAVHGQNATVTVYLASANGTCTDTITFPTYLQVTRELRMSGQAMKSGRNGETVDFLLNLTNRGDVREENITILHLLGVGEDWPVSVDKSNATLDPGESTSFTVSITIPDDAPGSVPGLFQIAAYSSADTTVRTGIQLTIIPATAISIGLNATPADQEIRPGTSTDYLVNITNVGNLPSAAKIDLTVLQGPTTYTGILVTISRNVVYLRGGESTTVVLSVFVPLGIRAGLVFNETLTAFNANYAAEARVTVRATVGAYCGIWAQAGPLARIDPGGEGASWFSVANDGNADANVEIAAGGLPIGWNLSLLDAGNETRTIVVVPGQSLTLDLLVRPPATAVAGKYHFTLTASSLMCGTATVSIAAEVTEVGAATMTAEPTVDFRNPGDHSTFRFFITSTRNAPMDVTVSADDLYGYLLEFGALWLLLDPEDQAISRPIPYGQVHLAPFGTAVVELVMGVPPETTAAEIGVPVRMDVPNGNPVYLPLKLVIRWPDLALARADWDFENATEGDRLNYTVTVRNLGSRAGGTGFVAMTVDGVTVLMRPLGSIDPGESAIFEFLWLAVAGRHNLSFALVVTAGPRDLNNSNDLLLVPLVVGTRAAVEPAMDLGGLALVALIGGAGTAVLVWKLRKRVPPIGR